MLKQDASVRDQESMSPAICRIYRAWTVPQLVLDLVDAHVSQWAASHYPVRKVFVFAAVLTR